MCLFPEDGYADVARLLAETMALSDGICGGRVPSAQGGPVPTTAAISRARMRLGPEPLQGLFEDMLARQAGSPAPPDAAFPRLRRRVIDGCVATLPHSTENAAVYGAERVPPQLRREQPGIRVTVLADNECGSLLGADLSPLHTELSEVAKGLAGKVGKGDLLIADGDYAQPALWHAASGWGAELLWSAPDRMWLPPSGAPLPDGSYLSRLPAEWLGGRSERTAVRVLAGGPGGSERLITSILDPETAPAGQLRATHAERWSLRRAVDQLPTLRSGGQHSVRSRSPEMARQEIWGHLLVYSAIRNFATIAVA
jgi:hypothetical protein